MTKTSELPEILAGPIIRRATQNQLVIWLVCSSETEPQLCVYDDQGNRLNTNPEETRGQTVQVGRHAFIHLLEFCPEYQALPLEVFLSYDILIGAAEYNLKRILPHVLYEHEERPTFVIKNILDQVLHGSCRKPHHDSPDALLRVDQLIQDTGKTAGDRPALLLMSGDQVYCDDVAGPTLVAIHQVIKRLGLYGETLEGSKVKDSDALYRHDYTYYQREKLLPQTKATELLRERFYGGARKPIFTAVSTHNHLVTLAEVIAMYLLVWSPQLWEGVELDTSAVGDEWQLAYRRDRAVLHQFVNGLPRVQRMLAHIPTYMIFDDHDVTDDWNLTRGWEEVAYANPFSKRIIGNALIGYFLFQGWGNAPARFTPELVERIRQCAQKGASERREVVIDELLDYEHWDYTLPSTPKLVVMDTRTRRWWSESSLSKPSGLMEWEALSELQQELIGQEAVLLVSPAPIFGVKLIEVIQRIMTYFGQALIVDAENWMAHPGSANVILNIFRHRRTPQHFVILSGDVHYSFSYDVRIRHRKNSPHIWQITSSGFKNEFPQTLLVWFDRLNRWMFASRSPLNWFTRRRKMLIKSRKPSSDSVSRLVNASAVGRLFLDKNGSPESISILLANGGEVKFERD